MELAPKGSGRVRFGPYEANFRESELRRQGLKVKLNEKPFQVLSVLVERAGSLVRREELRQRLWPADTYVDFDANLNTALSTLRHTLGDSSDNPVFIETIPRQGYRFIAPVTVIEEERREGPVARVGAEGVASGAAAANSEKQTPKQTGVLLWAGTLLALVLAAVAGLLYFRWMGRSARAETVAGTATILVTPFENLSGDPNQEYLSDGLTDEMITRLGESSPRQLSVIARSTAMQYKGTKKTVEQIAREQHVDYVLEGCMRRQGDRVRITAQLFKGGAPGSLWTEAYERNANDLLTIQRDVADRIAGSLSLTLFPAAASTSSESAGINPKAYDVYLKGVYQCRHLYANGPKAALQFFQQAIDEQPNFARAYAELASCYESEIRGGFLRPDQGFPPAKVAVQKALELDNSLAEAHLVLADLLYSYEWDWSGAENEFRQAINLNPSSEWAHGHYATYLMLLSRFDEALAEAQKAQQLDPMSLAMDSTVCLVYSEAREYEKSIQECRRILEIDPKFIVAHYYIGVSEIYERKYAEALSELKTAKPLGDSVLLANAVAHATAGDKQQALQELEQLKQHSKTAYVSPYGMAEIYNHLGYKEKAFQMLDESFREHCDDLIYLNIDPDFDDLRDNPRFKQMLARIGFASGETKYPTPPKSNPAS
jgi:TolB-like protein/DNA-binding winged helix-turn-helix (wHTH) protein/Tfp pilus assembly protein PilF